MDARKLGLTILVITVLLAAVVFFLFAKLKSQEIELGCSPSSACKSIEQSLSITHLAVGVLAFALALGFYLLFFVPDQNSVFKKLEEASRKRLEEEKFSILLKALDGFEKEVMIAVKNQEGITQSSLKFKTSLSKAKLSQVLQDLEKKELISRKKKNKTYEVYLRSI